LENHQNAEISTRSKLAKLARPNDQLALLILIVDFIIYFTAVFFAVVSESILIKALCASLAGFMIAQLFVIAHDAAHRAYVSSIKANALIARLTFLPSLHNYSLWLLAHNQTHHAHPNLQYDNSWSPLTLEEYQALPLHKKLIQRLYRSTLGFGPYYLQERWLKDKFVPRKHIPQAHHKKAWKDFAFLAVYIIVFLAVLIALASYANQNILAAIFFGAVVPFVVWNYAMGLTTYQHHTHDAIKWYKSKAAWRNEVSNQGDVTVHVKYPTWYNIITHNIYIHPAHHLNPKIPLYHLPKTEAILLEDSNNKILTVPFSLIGFIKTVHKCKLYNYEQQQWLNFKGEPS
jgi:omega-6 fatty acid desaturase (delta-12 desaturase)